MTKVPLRCAQLGKVLDGSMLGTNHFPAEAADSFADLHHGSLRQNSSAVSLSGLISSGALCVLRRPPDCSMSSRLEGSVRVCLQPEWLATMSTSESALLCAALILLRAMKA